MSDLPVLHIEQSSGQVDIPDVAALAECLITLADALNALVETFRVTGLQKEEKR